MGNKFGGISNRIKRWDQVPQSGRNMLPIHVEHPIPKNLRSKILNLLDSAQIRLIGVQSWRKFGIDIENISGKI